MEPIKFAAEMDPELRSKREALLEAEVALKNQRERVAEMRRSLPPGPVVETDYVFREGPPDLTRNAPSELYDTRLSELFTNGPSLLVDHMMFDPEDEQACPMCSMWADGYDAVAPHVTDKTNFVLIARAPIERLRAWGRRRGWRHLRLLSSYGNTFNQDFLVEQHDSQLPALSVFTSHGGVIRHFYTTAGSLEFRHHRGIDLYTPVWNLFDLLPEGREDWFPEHFYDERR